MQYKQDVTIHITLEDLVKALEDAGWVLPRGLPALRAGGGVYPGYEEEGMYLVWTGEFHDDKEVPF